MTRSTEAGHFDDASTTVGALVGEIAAIIDAAGIPEAGREARDLIAALRDVPRFWTTVNGHLPLTADERATAVGAARKRASGAPLAYAARSAAFRRLTLYVDERVLIPRPETELIVDIVMELVGSHEGGIAIDVGTGSGAIALALATEARFDRVLAGDISTDALDVARLNAARLGPSVADRIEFRDGSLLTPFIGESAAVVVSNPPYLAEAEARELPRDVRDWEPAVALYSGPDGMTALRTIARQACHVVAPGGHLVLEVDSRRASWAVEAVSMYDCWTEIGVRLDLTGRERFVIARKRDNR